MMTVERAVEVFVRGFQFTRSFTHPYLAERIEPQVWRMYDGLRKSGDSRSEEFVGWGREAEALDALARQHSQGRFKMCAILGNDESDTGLRADFKRLGYRLMGTEGFFVHSLESILSVPEPYPIVRVTTEAQAEVLAKAAGRRKILPEHLTAEPAPMRQYMSLDGDTPVGWVDSITASGCTWCNSMFVVPSYRRRGIARALLGRMLADDRAAGADASVLLSSHTGAHLYPTIGYEAIGKLLMFTPPKVRE